MPWGHSEAQKSITFSIDFLDFLVPRTYKNLKKPAGFFLYFLSFGLFASGMPFGT